MGFFHRNVTILLIAPIASNRRTGGHLVNDRLAEDPSVQLLHVRSLEDAADLVARRAGDSIRMAVVIDSLFLQDTMGIRGVKELLEGPIGLIAHSLPSLIPGGPSAGRRRMLEAEINSLLLFDFVVAPSRFMIHALTKRGLPPEKAFQIEPAPIVDGRGGKALRDRPAGSLMGSIDRPIQILTIANWSFSKGIDRTWIALQGVSDINWRWTVIGEWESTEFGQELHGTIASSRLADRITVRRAVSPGALRGAYDSADLFVLPSIMESYGLVFAEALTYGLPILAASAGAVPEVLGDAALLTPAGDEGSISRGIRLLTMNSMERERLSRLALERSSQLPKWPQMRDRFISTVGATVDPQRPDPVDTEAS